MSFTKKNWKDTVSEYPNRRKLKDIDTGNEMIYDVYMEQGNVTTAGNEWKASEMNDLEDRIDAAFTAISDIEKNAKTSETNAAASATSASTSATNAKASENVATTKASNAATSESNAKTYETNAKAAAAEAAVSEGNAKASETVAATSAANAATSATNAKTSETNAKTSETNAKISETNAKSSSTSADTSATKAESYAVGGTDSRDGEDTDNAKYYKEQSEASKTSAATSASTATTKASEASSSASSAKTYASNASSSASSASTSATNASASATKAKTSETNAANSESNAKTSEANAKTYSTTATTSATNAKTSETNAKTSETNANASAIKAESYTIGGTDSRDGEDTDNAKYYKEQCASLKSEASTSASTAKTYATTATTKASEASTSASNAKTSATNASTSETNAKTYASTASTKASEASTSASGAKTSATNAATSESNAKSSASAAATSENNAKTYETNAASSASTATAKASAAATSATNANTYAISTKSYAVGGTNSRDGEDTDNAKYYKEQCATFASQVNSLNYDNLINKPISVNSSGALQYGDKYTQLKPVSTNSGTYKSSELYASLEAVETISKKIGDTVASDLLYNPSTSKLTLIDSNKNTIGDGVTIDASDTGVLFLTQAEYDADKDKYDAMKAFIVITDAGETDANAITYDNTTSKLSATQVQSAIDEIVTEKADTLTFNEDTSQIELRAGGTSGTILSNVTVSTGASDTIRVTTTYETWKLNSNVTVKITNSSGDETFTGHFDITGLYKHAIHFVDTYIITVTDADGKVYTRKKVVKSVDSQLYTIPIEPNIIYGFAINGADSNPASMVSYIEGTDCEGFTPAYMDYTADAFNYGSWEDAFFMPRPTLLSQDGKVFCYLDPNNYTLDEDGNDVSSYLTGSAGVYNAMMEWGTNDGRRIYYKVVPKDNNSGEVYISDSEVDSDYKCWSFYNWDGNLSDHFYTPIYNGSNVSSVLRSLSGKSILNSATASTEITYAKANGTGWYTETLADRILINFLLILIGRSTDTQATFGNGHYTGGSSASNLLTTGTMNSRGLFYGTNGTGAGVKVFGMENWWGNQWRRLAGWINASGTQKIKLTYGTQDGSSVTGYNTDGTNYISISATPAGTSGGYTNIMAFNQYGMFNKNAAGSATTYYCDGLWFNNSQTNYARVGGDCLGGLRVGALCVCLDSAASSSYWSFGAALSYHG